MSVDGPDQDYDSESYGPRSRPLPRPRLRAWLAPLEAPIRPSPKPAGQRGKELCARGREALARGNTTEAALHKYDGDNLLRTSRGGRPCRYCANEKSRVYKRLLGEKKKGKA